MKKKTFLVIAFAIIFFILLGTNVFASSGVAGNVANDVVGAVEGGGEMLRSAGNAVVNGAVTAGDYARDAGNMIVNGTDTAIDAITDNQTLANGIVSSEGVRPTGEGAKNQTQTMTTDNVLSGNNLSSGEFLGIKFSVWMWIVLIIVIIVIIALICKYMKEHDDENDTNDEE